MTVAYVPRGMKVRPPFWLKPIRFSMRPTDYDRTGRDGLYLVEQPEVQWWARPFVYAWIAGNCLLARIRRGEET